MPPKKDAKGGGGAKDKGSKGGKGGGDAADKGMCCEQTLKCRVRLFHTFPRRFRRCIQREKRWKFRESTSYFM